MANHRVAIDGDRRQSARLRCGGPADIFVLPFEGSSVLGRVLNLSLGGCSIESGAALPPGTRAEILMRVSTASIRVVGQVRALQARSVMGVEFLLLSAYGKDMLVELMQEMAWRQALAFRKGAREQGISAEATRPILRGERPLLGEGLIRLDRSESGIASYSPGISGATSGESRILVDADELDLYI